MLWPAGTNNKRLKESLEEYEKVKGIATNVEPCSYCHDVNLSPLNLIAQSHDVLHEIIRVRKITLDLHIDFEPALPG